MSVTLLTCPQKKVSVIHRRPQSRRPVKENLIVCFTTINWRLNIAHFDYSEHKVQTESRRRKKGMPRSSSLMIDWMVSDNSKWSPWAVQYLHPSLGNNSSATLHSVKNTKQFNRTSLYPPTWHNYLIRSRCGAWNNNKFIPEQRQGELHTLRSTGLHKQFL